MHLGQSCAPKPIQSGHRMGAEMGGRSVDPSFPSLCLRILEMPHDSSPWSFDFIRIRSLNNLRVQIQVWIRRILFIVSDFVPMSAHLWLHRDENSRVFVFDVFQKMSVRGRSCSIFHGKMCSWSFVFDNLWFFRVQVFLKICVRVHSCSHEHERAPVFALYVFVFVHPWLGRTMRTAVISDALEDTNKDILARQLWNFYWKE